MNMVSDNIYIAMYILRKLMDVIARGMAIWQLFLIYPSDPSHIGKYTYHSLNIFLGLCKSPKSRITINH